MLLKMKNLIGSVISKTDAGSKRKGASKKVLPMTFIAVFTAFVFAAVTTSSAIAQGANPIDAVARALDLEPSQLQSCLGEPPARGTQPSEADHAALVDCLLVQNPSLTVDQINAAIGQMRNGPPPKS